MEMINAQRYLSNTAALRRVGINLLPGEELDAAVELETGLTDELEPSHEELLLTTRRLIRYPTGGHYVDTLSIVLEDVHSVKVKRRQGCSLGSFSSAADSCWTCCRCSGLRC